MLSLQLFLKRNCSSTVVLCADTRSTREINEFKLLIIVCLECNNV